MSREEESFRRPSRLSSVFRRAARENGGRLRDWTRHIDGDWIWYCPVCFKVVILIEEKGYDAKETKWGLTVRLAKGHEDKPWAWRVTTYPNGTFTVKGKAVKGGSFHEFAESKALNEYELTSWIEKAFIQHYKGEGHQFDASGNPAKQGLGSPPGSDT